MGSRLRVGVFATALGLFGTLSGAGGAEPRRAEPAQGMGVIRFPVTARSAEAREHFQRGVLALHSFFYDEALDEFRAATAKEPGFAMGRWGEAMALNETIWEWQDLEGGRAALLRVSDTGTLPEKEQALIAAARLLYGEGTRPARAAAFAAELTRLHARWPDDDEITAFTSLALLGTLGPGDPGVATRMRAGALALEVLGKNPSHPGAAHYVIHSFDDPVHAILALPAARRYARIAPEAFHARHMPAHIFVQLGMWEDATASCESAWAASRAWVARRKHALQRADFHSLNWLVSLQLQRGRRDLAESALDTFREAIAKENATPMRMGYLNALLPFLRETGEWTRAEALLAPLARPATLSPEEKAVACHPTAGNAPAGVYERIGLLVLRAHVAAVRGEERSVIELRRELAEAVRRLAGLPQGVFLGKQLRAIEASTAGYLSLARKKPAEAAREFLKAGAVDDELGGNSFADPGVIPWEEEAGFALLLAGQKEQAAAAFATSLAKRPGRARSSNGAAQAGGQGAKR